MEAAQTTALKGKETGEEDERGPDEGDKSGNTNFEMNDVQRSEGEYFFNVLSKDSLPTKDIGTTQFDNSNSLFKSRR